MRIERNMAYYTYQDHQEYYCEQNYDSPVYYTNFDTSTYEEQDVGHPDQGTYEDNYNLYTKAFMPNEDVMASGFGPEVEQEEGESQYQEEVWEEEEIGKFNPREEFGQEYGQVEDFREYSPTQDWEEGEGTWDWERGGRAGIRRGRAVRRHSGWPTSGRPHLAVLYPPRPHRDHSLPL